MGRAASLPVRRRLLLLPALLAVVACSATSEDESVGDSQSMLTDWGPCSLSRAEILKGASEGRRRAIERGFKWLDDGVRYSQSSWHEGYRQDCSGFVGMCWELTESPVVSTFYDPGRGLTTTLNSYDALVPGDALARSRSSTDGHIALFLGWEEGKAGACVLEQSSSKNNMKMRIRATTSLKAEGYRAVRSVTLVDDGAAPDFTTPDGTVDGPDGAFEQDEDMPAGEETNTPSTPSTPTRPKTTTKPKTTSTKKVCQPWSALEACGLAWGLGGLECGTTDDGCGRAIDCDTLPTFGCASGETCDRHHKCVAPTCTPLSAEELCADARAAQGVECGVVDDGCGGTTNCDLVTSFGCKTDEKCGTANRCEANPFVTAPKVDTSVPGDTGDDESKPKTKKPLREYADSGDGTASSGCNASPTNAGGDALPFLAVALAAGLVRRRRSPSSPSV